MSGANLQRLDVICLKHIVGCQTVLMQLVWQNRNNAWMREQCRQHCQGAELKTLHFS